MRKTHCKSGHALIGYNIRVYKRKYKLADGSFKTMFERVCRACIRIAQRKTRGRIKQSVLNYSPE
jgi:hypothetical protein